MPTIILSDRDLKQAIDYLTAYRYEINTIVSKKINDDDEIEIRWSYNEKEKHGKT